MESVQFRFWSHNNVPPQWYFKFHLDMDENISQAKVVVLNTFRGLAADGTQQVNFYPSYVCTADELALMLEDALPFVRALRKRGEISEKAYEIIEDLDGLTSSLSGEQNAKFWTNDALLHDPVWDTIRQKSSAVLVELGDADSEEGYDPNVS